MVYNALSSQTFNLPAYPRRMVYCYNCKTYSTDVMIDKDLSGYKILIAEKTVISIYLSIISTVEEFFRRYFYGD